MKTNNIYSYIHKQIPVMMVLSLFPGLFYILLGWLNDYYLPAVAWYLVVSGFSVRGYILWKQFNIEQMSENQLETWYRQASVLFYLFFLVWLIIFLIYSPEYQTGMHYIAIFTEIGAATVAAAILYPDKKLYKPTILFLMIPLVIYFGLLGTWYGYVLTIFSSVYTWVLLYAANGSNSLFLETSFQSTHDSLTGLYNRQFFIEYLQKRMNTIRQNKHYSFILLIDLDHFKTVNDSLGHDVGDQLLQEVVIRISGQLKKNKILIARLGGDEFIITGTSYMDEKICKDEAVQLSNNILSEIKSSYIINQHHLHISASIGVSILSPEGRNATEFIKEADIAMYEAKSKGRDGVFLFDDSMSEKVEYTLKIEQLLHQAILNNEIWLAFQPQVNEKNVVSGVEVLSRWSNKEIGNVSPVEFIAIAEKTGLIIELGYLILESAFKTAREWNNKGINVQHMSINISVRQFMHYQFIDEIKELWQKYMDDTVTTTIVFEITESIVAEGQRIVEVINELRELGIRFAIDDFGTGYSSLNYIRTLPLNELKIDRQFISDMVEFESSREMVNTIINIAKIFDLLVVAEGVETEEQREFLLDNGCRIFQGFLFAKPLTGPEFEQYYLEMKKQEQA